ncbi:MAG TPA: RdgB/HAM1 family non-canonical purine NTP pyrophosphatase [Candidatus Dormibacteraeota bacterium]|nr:RdgB/HAM1 family non-canonical purine NTP pyrophosphatase [Candidatus Dormibacteraeota bacterium]
MRAPSKPLQLFVASSNEGKLREYRALAASAGAPANRAIELTLIPNFDAAPPFEEVAPTFAENAAGKALHYSRFAPGLVIADDSGLVVPALGGAPGVHSARYAGPDASDADRIRKLLEQMRGKKGEDRKARFVCVIVLAEAGEARGLFSAAAEGEILEAPRGGGGFGYDPVFFIPALGKTYAEISREEKNQYSHRGKAFRKALEFLMTPPPGRSD